MKAIHSCGLSALFTAAILAGCGSSPEKPKLETTQDKDGIDRYDAVSSPATADGWNEVRVIDSAHPYTNNANNHWTVDGNANSTDMRVVFERLELEQDYDFLVITNATGDNTTRHTGTETGRELVVSGSHVDLRLTSDGSVTGWGFRAHVFERHACICTALYDPVCGADGQTYSNSCAAACANATIAHTGACSSTNFTAVPQSVESAHPYTNSMNRSWTLSFAGAREIRVHFSRIDTERGYDFVRILDANGTMVHEYTGSSSDVTTPSIHGESLRVQLQSDSSVTGWGFAVDRIEVAAGCSADSDCGANEQCVQVQCIRAPCFNSCQPIPSQYAPVTVASLLANPAAFDGHSIEVEATPEMSNPVCTRIACGPSNPCCNRCSSSFSIEGIALASATGTAFGCSGNECNVQSSCNPAFDARDAGEYVFRGTFHALPFGGSQLTVDNFEAHSCAPTGCSGTVCANSNAVITTCQANPADRCYQSASCAPQASGLCGWTQTPALTQCIADANTTQPQTISATGLPARIPDNNQTGVSSSINVSGASSNGTVTVSAGITHTYRGDLRVRLVAPNGTERVLSDRAGGSFDNLTITNTDVTATAGGVVNGRWTLIVQDLASQDTGSLDRWSLTVH
ncbi:MAG: proprotein convertase P-domain-containing protein [Myxococcota bacterium]